MFLDIVRNNQKEITEYFAGNFSPIVDGIVSNQCELDIAFIERQNHYKCENGSNNISMWGSAILSKEIQQWK